MNPVEEAMFDFIRERHEAGALSVTSEEVLAAVVPASNPKVRFRPAYKYGLIRLLRRAVINAIVTPDGVHHYYIGNVPSAELRRSLGV